MDRSGVIWIDAGVQAENNPSDFAPVCTFVGGIK